MSLTNVFRSSSPPLQRLFCSTFRNVPYQCRWNSQAIKLNSDPQRRPPLAFALDIDGVLIRGQHALPQGKRALRILDRDNELGIKIPYILITNGGGTTEAIRCQRLSELLDIEISVNQFMQAHTIYKTVAREYADKPVLVLGGEPGAIPRVAKEYGFRKAISPLEIKSWNPSIWPFHDLTEEERAFVDSRPRFDPTTRFAGIFVFHDPRNWALDIQISLDILRNNGYVLPTSLRPAAETPPPGAHGDNLVQLFFCNPDLLWGSDYPTPRIGQGAFRVAFQSAYQSLTGMRYPYVQYGKPTKPTFAYAEKLLRKRLRELVQQDESDINISAKKGPHHTPKVYMIGDNPESDIAGANTKGWQSVLVKTGVYDPARGPPTHEPTHIADDVEQAVRWAIKRESSAIQ